MKIIKRNMTIGLVLLAVACGGVSTEGPVTVETTVTDAKEAEPERVITEEERFRMGYKNPGGMWMPSQMTVKEHMDNFKKMGVSISSAQLSDPLSDPLASIVFLGGCSASFVSPDGLVVTNHHCVQGALRHNSGEKQNLVEDGFLAKDKASELNAGPTRRVKVAKSFKDVTKEMREGLEKIKNPIKRKEESARRYKELLKECEKDKPGIKCSLRSFFGGGLYKLIEYMEIRDVRLVYVPRRSIGNYGGEIDNWQWPRHTGDFAFYRAYVGPDGKPADYSKDNVPFKPKHYLKVSTEGVRPHDFVMVVGYPGKTYRTDTAATVKHDVEWYYPLAIKYLDERYKLTEKFLKSGDKNTAMKAGVAKQFVQNGLENYQGKVKGLTSGNLLERKTKLDADIKAWAAEPDRESFKADIEKMEELEAGKRKTANADFIRRLALRGSALLGVAVDLVRMAEERPKKDEDRKPGYQERDIPDKIARQKAFLRAYDRTLDKAVFKHSLTWAAELPKKNRPWLGRLLGTKKKIDETVIEEALSKMYSTTKLEDEALRIELMQKGTKAGLRKTKDPFLKAALAIWPILKKEEKKEDRLKGELLVVVPAYAHAMREVLGGALAPDANATLRITYGTVKSFNPDSDKEADWPFTTAKQILKKHTGKKPFDTPKDLLEAVEAKNYGPYAKDFLGGELPVDFLSDLDITGGNSGSATLNDKGELVGLAFDGTIEGVASDVVFNGETSRTIQADVRYMLWVMDALDGADHILKEMGVEPTL